MRGTDGRYYDRTFDLDRDGKLDAGEICFMDEMIFGHHGDSSSDSCDDDEFDEDDLEDMDANERKEYMEENGLDADDCDGDWD